MSETISNTARELIARAFWESIPGTGDTYPTEETPEVLRFLNKAADNVIAALPSIIGEMVQPLEWGTANETIYWCQTPYGRYSVWETFDGEGYASLPGRCGGYQVPGGLEVAKDAANAHYRDQCCAPFLKAPGMEGDPS